MPRPTHPDPIEQEKAEAWIGDAALALVARRWLLQREGRACGEKFARLTSNQFLVAWGNPTAVEARIGRLYEEGGIDAVAAFFEGEMVPLFLRQERNRAG